MGDLISQLGLDWRLILSQLFNFILLLIVLERFVYRPILKVVDTRKLQIEKNDKQEKSLEKKLGEMGSIKENVLREAEEAGEKLRASILEQTEETKAHILETAKKEAERIVEAERRGIQDEIERIQESVQSQIGGAMAIAIEKSLSDVLDEESRAKMLERSVEQFLTEYDPQSLEDIYSPKEVVTK